jgi:hypothetical protein
VYYLGRVHSRCKALLKCLNKLYSSAKIGLLYFNKFLESLIKSVDTISSEELNSLLYKSIRKLHAHPLRPNLLYEGGRYISDEISGDLDRSVLPFSRDSEIGLRWTGDLTVDKTVKVEAFKILDFEAIFVLERILEFV